MAIPIRSIPVLEGEVWHKFKREAEKAERERGTIKFPEETIEAYRNIIKKAKLS
jgi:hypothetical protein